MELRGSDLLKEEWKWISGYDGIYQISNYGRLKSFRKDKNGYICSNTDKNGWYFTVNLYDELGRMKTERIHVLVAKEFIGEIRKGYHVHHKDGNKQNNRVDNLEIISPLKHRAETARQRPNLTKAMNEYNKYERPIRIRQYTQDGHFLAEYINAKVASDMTGVCQRNILQVANKEPFNNKGNIRKQAGGYVWKYADESEVV